LWERKEEDASAVAFRGGLGLRQTSGQNDLVGGVRGMILDNREFPQDFGG